MRIWPIILLFSPLFLGAQLYIPSNGLIHIAEGANLEVGGNLENDGAIQNLGTLSLYSDWIINNNFNGLEGRLQFLGSSDQLVTLRELTVSEIVMNQGGKVSFSGDEYLVLDRIDFQFGNITTEEDTRFVFGPGVNVNGGSNFSYFDGILISQGSGIKTFPVGNDGLHAPVTLLNVFGVDTEIATRFTRGNAVDPIPGDSLLGVSNNGIWEVELIAGTTDPTLVELTFREDNLALNAFQINNPIRHRVNSPVIAISDNPEGPFETLGVQQIVETDSLTTGIITSETRIMPIEGQKIYLAMALAPRIPSEGLYFIPEAFSPQASDPINQTFRIFGERISEEGFSLQIYNRLGVLVYSTNSFKEVNETGWNGENQNTGVPEPTGVYYYSVKFQFQTGLPISENGAFYIVK